MCLSRFQFHIGSIQSFNRFFDMGEPDRFQFHIGSIQRPGLAGPGERLHAVSIPHWFDSKGDTPGRLPEG